MPAKWQQWMPFHIDRFMGSPAVRSLPLEAQMAYLYLLAKQWQSEDCTISGDTADLEETSCMGPELWALHGPRILRKFQSVNGNGRLRNQVCYEEWQDAKRVFDARKSAADKTNQTRSPNGHRAQTDTVTERLADTRTTVVPVSVSVPVSVANDLSVDTRILSESVGIFGMREQADMNRLLAVHMKESGRTVEQAIHHMTGRWEEYQTRAPSLSWTYGSSHKFFMGGFWDKPETWSERPKSRSEKSKEWSAPDDDEAA